MTILFIAQNVVNNFLVVTVSGLTLGFYMTTNLLTVTAVERCLTDFISFTDTLDMITFAQFVPWSFIVYSVV